MKKCAQSAVKRRKQIFRYLSDKVLDAEADGFSAQFLKGSCSGITVYHSVPLFSRKITAMRTVSRTFRGLRHCYGRKHSAMPCGRSDVPAVHVHFCRKKGDASPQSCCIASLVEPESICAILLYSVHFRVRGHVT